MAVLYLKFNSAPLGEIENQFELGYSQIQYTRE